MQKDSLKFISADPRMMPRIISESMIIAFDNINITPHTARMLLWNTSQSTVLCKLKAKWGEKSRMFVWNMIESERWKNDE